MECPGVAGLWANCDWQLLAASAPIDPTPLNVAILATALIGLLLLSIIIGGVVYLSTK